MSASLRTTALAAVLLCASAGAAMAGKVAVTTYHNDNFRTGWDRNETQLTQASVSGGTFGMIASAPLDDQVDAQPLIMPNQAISGQGTHDVVYVASESNTVYAIDATSGQVLLSRNFGAPVPYT